MRILIFALMLGLSVHAWAADFYFTKNNLWFDPTDKETVTAVLDLKGIEHATVQMLLSYYLPPPIFQRIQIEIAEQYGQPFVRATFSNMSHADLVRVSEMLPQFVQPRFGGTTMSPEIPLALRVENLKGHDDFVAAVTGLPLKTIKDIDKAAIKAEKTGKTLVVRYFLDDRKKDDPQDYKELRTANGDAVVTVIPANTYGQMPLSVPGKSVVFHSRSFHGMTILGSLNPGLANSQIAQALTANKYVEALFWNQYAPEALPETHLLANMNLNLANPLILVQQLNQMYPEGWVMKGVNESSSNFSIITDQTKLVEEIEAYSHSDFEQFKAKTYQEMAGYDEDNIYETLQEHKNYFGWRASLYLKNPTRVIIQRKVAIKREFRVEVIGGKVLVKGTIDRHNWLL
ncbi:MAG TPA: hypothetical protein VN132_04800, partial [Bdellovibrio sp.]|nr:hypothetical protein [Bdellovibrio sp.]